MSPLGARAVAFARERALGREIAEEGEEGEGEGEEEGEEGEEEEGRRGLAPAGIACF